MEGPSLHGGPLTAWRAPHCMDSPSLHGGPLTAWRALRVATHSRRAPAGHLYSRAMAAYTREVLRSAGQ